MTATAGGRRAAPAPQARRRLALGGPHLPGPHADLHSGADGVDAAHLDQVRFRRDAVSAAVVAEPSRRWRAIASCSTRRTAWAQDFLRYLLEQHVRFDRPPRSWRSRWRCRRPMPFRASSFPGRTFLFFSVLLRNMFPAVIFLVPLFILMRLLGLVNTHGSLVLTYLTFGLPLAIWLLKGFYDNIPIQLEQAARIDGATRLQAFLLDRHAALDRRASSPPRSIPSSGVERIHLRLHVPDQERADDAAGRHPALLRGEQRPTGRG